MARVAIVSKELGVLGSTEVSTREDWEKKCQSYGAFMAIFLIKKRRELWETNIASPGELEHALNRATAA